MKSEPATESSIFTSPMVIPPSPQEDVSVRRNPPVGEYRRPTGCGPRFLTEAAAEQVPQIPVRGRAAPGNFGMTIGEVEMGRCRRRFSSPSYRIIPCRGPSRPTFSPYLANLLRFARRTTMLSWLSPRLAKYCRLGLLLPAAAGVILFMTPAVGAPAKDAAPDLGYIFSPDLPHDVVALHAGAAGLQPSMDTMSWETLIALAWPASSTQNGVPDRNNQIGGIPPDPEGGSGKPAGPTVFETFKASEDIFLNPPVKPSGFNQPQRIPGPCLLQGASVAAHSKIMVRPTSIGATMHEVFEA